MDSLDLDIEYKSPSRNWFGQYENPKHWNFSLVSISKLLKWVTSRPPESQILRDDVDAVLPMHSPDFSTPVPSGKCKVTWMGHASILLQLPGITILTDPVYSERCSPVSFAGPKRYRPVPCQITDLPQIDAIIISHNHYDHMDLNTLSNLYKKYPQVKVFTPLSNSAYIESAGIPKSNIVELDWWHEDTLKDRTQEANTFRIICVPAQHWCKRTAFDTNKSLWGGFIFAGQQGSFYFAGDTGYNPTVFKAIGNRFGPISVSAIPIGAYHPRKVMKMQHVDPLQAIYMHRDVKSRASVGIHWGTFVLTDEPIMEPLELLKQQGEQEGLKHDEFVSLMHGESRIYQWALDNN